MTTAGLLREGGGTSTAIPDAELQLLERQMRRYGGDGGGDCAYERALGRLYLQLFERRRDQLDALRKAGL